MASYIRLCVLSQNLDPNLEQNLEHQANIIEEMAFQAYNQGFGHGLQYNANAPDESKIDEMKETLVAEMRACEACFEEVREDMKAGPDTVARSMSDAIYSKTRVVLLHLLMLLRRFDASSPAHATLRGHQ